MGIKKTTIIVYEITCDGYKCEQKLQGFDALEKVYNVSSDLGWRQRKPKTITVENQVWFCPACMKQYKISESS